MHSYPSDYRALAQPFKTPIKMVTHVTERLVESLTDLSQPYLFKIKQFQRFSLNLGQFFESGAQSSEIKPGLDLPLHIALLWQLLKQSVGIDIPPLIELFAPQVSPLVKRPAVGDLNNPYLCASPGRIEKRSLPKHIEETLLHGVLRLANLLQDAECDAIYKVGVTLE